MRIFLLATIVGAIVVAICAGAVKESKGQSHDIDKRGVAKVTYCELMKHPEKFHYKVVEVSAIFENGFEKSYLYDQDGCNKGLRLSETWAGFDKSFVIDGDSEEAKTNSKISGFGIWSITAIGRFRRAEGSQRFGHLGCCRYQFDFMKLVKSEKLSDRVR